MNQNQQVSVGLDNHKEGELIYTYRDSIYLNSHCRNPYYKVVNFHPWSLLNTSKASLLRLLDLVMNIKVYFVCSPTLFKVLIKEVLSV